MNAYNEGYEAFKAGTPSAHNPYFHVWTESSTEADDQREDEWDQGWIAAQNDGWKTRDNRVGVRGVRKQ